MIKLWIEDQEMDVTEGFSHQITYAIDDLNNLDSKATSFSKTIILPGTANNNSLLGNIFEFSNSNFTGEGPNVFYNFNASRSAKCRLDINNLTIIKGVLRLLEIVRDGDSIEYEVAIFGELGGFVSKLANKKLEELDFSLYSHVYDATNISDRWNDKPDLILKTGIVEDAMNYDTITIYSQGDLSETFSIGDDIEVVNQNGMFSYGLKKITDVYYARFTNQFSFTVDVPFGGGFFQGSFIYTIKNKGGCGVYYPLIDYGNYSTNKHDYQIKTFRPALFVKEYIDKIIKGAGYTYESQFFKTDFFKRLIVPHNQSVLETIKSDLFGGTFVDDNNIVTSNTNVYSLVKNLQVNKIFGDSFTTSDNIDYTYTGNPTTLVFDLIVNVKLTYDTNVSGLIGSGTYVNTLWVIKNNIATSLAITVNGNLFVNNRPGADTTIGYAYVGLNLVGNISINTGDVIHIESTTFVTVDNFNYLYSTLNIKHLNDNSLVKINSQYPITAPVEVGDYLEVNKSIPKNIQQRDFFTSVMKMFNLMVTEDKYKTNHLKIEPYIWFYNLNNSSYLDWSLKMDRSQAIKIRPMSEVNARFYDFKYKGDSDYFNDLYKKRYNEGYGDRRYDNELEFAKDTQSMEVIFASTPLIGYTEEDKVVPTIFKWNGGVAGTNEERVNSVIRIMQIKFLTAETDWSVLDGETALITSKDYPYAGHFDDPFTPSIDLNFGATKELFYTLNSGTLGENLFNTYYSPYMAEITDKDSRLVIAKFKFTDIDIFNLDFRKFIWLDGVLYRLSKIIDYTPGEICTVELLRVIYTTYGSSVNTADIPSVTICNKVWAQKNLDVIFDNQGDEIIDLPDSIDWKNATTGAWCYYDNDPANGRTYGKLYNWTDDLIKFLPPEGWKFPSIDDAEALLDCVNEDAYKLIEQTTAHWNTNDGNNESGFTALGAGWRDKDGIFSELKNITYFWLSDSRDSNNAYYLVIRNNGTWAIDYADKRSGFSVRLIRK